VRDIDRFLGGGVIEESGAIEESSGLRGGAIEESGAIGESGVIEEKTGYDTVYLKIDQKG